MGASSTDITQSILVLQKSALCLVYFAPYRNHAIPLFFSSYSLPITLLHFKSIIIIRDVFTVQKPSSSTSLTMKIASAQVVETSVANNVNSPSQDFSHPDDLLQPKYVTPGLKPFS